MEEVRVKALILGHAIAASGTLRRQAPRHRRQEDTRIYLRYRDDPWTTKSDPGFEKFYDCGADPYQVRNLAYYGEVSQATLDRLQDRLRGCRAYSCRAAENGG